MISVYPIVTWTISVISVAIIGTLTTIIIILTVFCYRLKYHNHKEVFPVDSYVEVVSVH